MQRTKLLSFLRGEHAWAVLLALYAYAALEARHVPREILLIRPDLLPSIVAQALAAVVAFFLPLLAYAGVVIAARQRKLSWLTVGVASALAAGFAYWVLIRYQPFRQSGALLGLFILLALFLFAAEWTLRGNASRSRLMAWALIATGVLGAYVTHKFNTRLYKGSYPTLHLSLSLASYLLLQSGFVGAARVFAGLDLIPAQWRARIAGCLGVGIAASVMLVASGLASAGQPHFDTYTLLGQSKALFDPFPRRHEVNDTPVADDPGASERLVRLDGLPDLPPDFHLSQFNLLLIKIEATRYDQTSLGAPELGTTPELVRFHGQGAFSFSRAYSPSSGTLQSTAALMSMTFPSNSGLRIWNKRTSGELPQSVTTPAELLARAGYDTFYVGHNHRKAFTDWILGMHQGFTQSHYIEDWRASPKTDAAVAKRAIEVIREHASRTKPFFGWLYFSSPHSHYKTHYPDWPAERPIDRYRQELHFADAQIGRVLAMLRDEDLLDETVVVITSDHGEEFQEHGGQYHKSTVYSESTRVPLLIHVPGIEGHPVAHPTSTMYVLPWLMLQGPPEMRNAVRMGLSEAVGPMLRETDGAVVAELLSDDRMLATLVYPRHKININVRSGLVEIYDVKADPLERHDLALADSKLLERYRDEVQGYLRVRNTRRDYSVHQEILAPTIISPYPEENESQ